MTLRPSASELVELVTLDDVRLFETNGKVRWDDSDQAENHGSGADQHQTGTTEESANRDTFDVDLRIGERADDRGIVAFFAVNWVRGPASASVTVGALYTVSAHVTEDIEYEEEALREFASRVAAYQMLPFAREGLISIAARLRIEPVPIMPLVPQGNGPGGLSQPG